MSLLLFRLVHLLVSDIIIVFLPKRANQKKSFICFTCQNATSSLLFPKFLFLLRSSNKNKKNTQMLDSEFKFKFKFLNKQFAVCNHLFLNPYPQESLNEAVSFLIDYNVQHVITFVDKSDALTRLTHNVLAHKVSQKTSRNCLFHHNPVQDMFDANIFESMSQLACDTTAVFLFEMKDCYEQCVLGANGNDDGDEYNQELEEFEEAHYLGGQALEMYRTERCQDYLLSLSQSRKQ